MDALRIGVIGVGGRGGLAYYAHRPEEGVVLAAGADIDDTALELFRETYGPDVFTANDYRALLARDLDAVFITSPDYCHEEHAVAALRAGKAIYLEKPMAITIEGCDRILETARQNGAKVFVGHNMRHMPFIRKMKELIDAGMIGEVKAGWCRHFIAYGGDAYFKDWHAERKNTTGLLLQKAVHDIDVLHFLCGGYTKRVNALGGLTLYHRVTACHPAQERGDARWNEAHWPPLSQTGLNPHIDVEDLSMMQMELDNGVYCSYQQCHYAPDAWRNYTIIGTEGRLENFGDEPGKTVIRIWNRRCHYAPEGNLQFPIPALQGSHGGSDPSIVDEFITWLRGKGMASTSPIDARNSVAAGYMATQSLRDSGAPQDIPPMDNALIRYFNSQED